MVVIVQCITLVTTVIRGTWSMTLSKDTPPDLRVVDLSILVSPKIFPFLPTFQILDFRPRHPGSGAVACRYVEL